MLVWATGNANIRPPIPGIGLDGVHQLRTVDDALRAAAQRGGRVVVVGTGFIGCEVAATPRGVGLEVTALDDRPRLTRRNGTTVLGARRSPPCARKRRERLARLHATRQPAGAPNDRRPPVPGRVLREDNHLMRIVRVGQEPHQLLGQLST